jgi:riboflavin kinase / FMN adenylyltransferase
MTAVFLNGLGQYDRAAQGNVVVTMGTFDGIHRGHQAILGRVKRAGVELGLNTVLITFDPHPRMVVTPNNVPPLLTTTEEKKKFIPCYFDGTVVTLKFDESVRNLTAEQFVEDFIVTRLGARKLIVGHDHAFGKNRGGDINELRRMAEKFGFEVEVVAPVMYEGSAVSSSRIRNAMLNNQYAEAIRLLGHEYAVYGTVERGIGLGRKLGYPTANVKYGDHKLLPPEGVYACYVITRGREYRGMMFIGKNHFNPSGRVTVEANLFEFDEDIYDEEITVYPIHFIRENRRYDSTAGLVDQIAKDKLSVLEIISQGEHTCP